MIIKNLRKYGKEPYTIVVVHGGPGAPGEMSSVAKELSKKFGVLEPLQTKDSIKDQIDELKETIIKNTNEPITLIGWSWGAWLSILLASKFPKLIKKLIIVGSGPFESKYVERITKTRMNRLSKNEKERAKELQKLLSANNNSNKDSLLSEFASIFSKTDSYNVFETTEKEIVKVNLDIYQKVWAEAESLRESGELLTCLSNIKCFIIAIHGDYDPHPANGVMIPLKKYKSYSKFILLNKCGHKPWVEKYAREKFYHILIQEQTPLSFHMR